MGRYAVLLALLLQAACSTSAAPAANLTGTGGAAGATADWKVLVNDSAVAPDRIATFIASTGDQVALVGARGADGSIAAIAGADIALNQDSPRAVHVDYDSGGLPTAMKFSDGISVSLGYTTPSPTDDGVTVTTSALSTPPGLAGPMGEVDVICGGEGLGEFNYGSTLVGQFEHVLSPGPPTISVIEPIIHFTQIATGR
jgi:hypothetical protein